MGDSLDHGESGGWDHYAAGWDDDDAARAYAAAVYESLLPVPHARDLGIAGARVLDFGCGTGLFTTTSALADSDVQFDLIVCSSVCSFLDDYPGTVRDLVSRLVGSSLSGTGNENMITTHTA